VSDIPASAFEDGVVLGIDEAGRGPVLGPMVYGLAFWNASKEADIPKGFQDSKALSEETRNKLFRELLDHADIGFCMRAFLPSEISRNMLRENPYNLNQMSHDAAILLIRKLLVAGVKIEKCFIDTVGIASHYQRKLETEFPGLSFVVESKADANYAPCSAASVVAKVIRDRMLEGWKFSESGEFSRDFGSGYPSDPKCKAWMENLHDKVYGYNDFVRFSWRPVKQRMEDQGVAVTFEADVDPDETMQKAGMSAFLTGSKKRKRLAYFEQRKLQVVNKLATY
jgi:ribonuclease H2 subunit A